MKLALWDSPKTGFLVTRHKSSVTVSSLFQAALNMLTKSLSCDLKKFGILATAILPGLVDTDMGRGAPSSRKISVQDSVGGMMKVIAKDNGDEINGKYFSYTGKEFPW